MFGRASRATRALSHAHGSYISRPVQPSSLCTTHLKLLARQQCSCWGQITPYKRVPHTKIILVYCPVDDFLTSRFSGFSSEKNERRGTQPAPPNCPFSLLEAFAPLSRPARPQAPNWSARHRATPATTADGALARAHFSVARLFEPSHRQELLRAPGGVSCSHCARHLRAPGRVSSSHCARHLSVAVSASSGSSLLSPP